MAIHFLSFQQLHAAVAKWEQKPKEGGYGVGTFLDIAGAARNTPLPPTPRSHMSGGFKVWRVRPAGKLDRKHATLETTRKQMG